MPQTTAANASTMMRGNLAYFSGTKCERTSMRKCLLLRAAAIEAINAIQSTIKLMSSSVHTKPMLKNMRNTIWPTARIIMAPNSKTSETFSAAVPQLSSRFRIPGEASGTIAHRCCRRFLPGEILQCAIAFAAADPWRTCRPAPSCDSSR